jgi:hypothetical protein
MRQVYFGRIHDSLARPIASRHVDGLGAVASLLPTAASGFASLSAAPVLRLRQFIAGIIDDIPLRMVRRKRDL